jgi:hypothetical protein
VTRAIEELKNEGFVVNQCNSNYEKGIKLTVKGALQLGLRQNEA